MRSIQLLVLALLAMSAKAEGIPDLEYFYSCASGLVDCSGFGAHHESFVPGGIYLAGEDAWRF